MADISHTLAAKSDQLNADDLMGGAIDAVVERVDVSKEGEQPVAIYYAGCDNKPWKPCKSMRRVLAHGWGKDSAAWAGRTLRLFRDDAVTYAGAAVGGIRISHMSHIERAFSLNLAATRKSKKAWSVEKLDAPAPTAKPAPTLEKKQAAARKAADGIIAELKAATDQGAVLAKHDAVLDKLKAGYAALYKEVQAAITPDTPETPQAADDEIEFI